LEKQNAPHFGATYSQLSFSSYSMQNLWKWVKFTFKHFSPFPASYEYKNKLFVCRRWLVEQTYWRPQ